jgi:hypothetical protein
MKKMRHIFDTPHLPKIGITRVKNKIVENYPKVIICLINIVKRTSLDNQGRLRILHLGFHLVEDLGPFLSNN